MPDNNAVEKEQPQPEAALQEEEELVVSEEPLRETPPLPSLVNPESLGLRSDALQALRSPLRGEFRPLPPSKWVYCADQTVGLRLMVARRPSNGLWSWCLHITHGKKTKKNLGKKHLKHAIDLMFKGLRVSTSHHTPGLVSGTIEPTQGYGWLPLATDELAALRQVWIDKGWPLEELDGK